MEIHLAIFQSGKGPLGIKVMPDPTEPCVSIELEFRFPNSDLILAVFVMRDIGQRYGFIL